jgi:hypothetical protein
MNTTLSTYDPATPARNIMKGAPTIKKWGIFDKFDGYYYEIANAGDSNDLRCVRRTQALIPYEPDGIETTSDAWNKVVTGSGSVNIKAGNWGEVGIDPVIFRNGLCYVAAAINDPSLCYAPGDVQAIESAPNSISDYTYNEGYAVRLAYRDAGGSFVEHLAGRQFAFPFDQRESDTYSPSDYENWKVNNLFLKPTSEYIRLDAHCRWQDLVTNLSRGGGTSFSPEIGVSGDAIVANTDDARFGYDTAPDETDSGVKVWNLLVTVQGGAQISNAQYSAAFPSPHRASSYDVNNSNIGRKNITLKEWFKICVPPQFRTVYEWRPVRAMFSNDQLNGQSQNIVRWSDVSTANVDPTVIGVKRPGDPVTIDGQVLTDSSVYDVDFTKVTMWKIEFSWYGAVGALFLCYVPVGNGEARWVRVHHMRASNQLDVASLGNATLPITYLTHSGLSNGLPGGGKSVLVKYGASYYIDGGDKGTVKLLSKSSDFAKEVSYAGIKTTVATVPASNYFSILTSAGVSQADKDQLIGSYLKSDTTMKVIWVENDSTNRIRLYFNRSTSAYASSDPIELIVPRRQRSMVALRAKDEVTNTTGTPIRNRLQLYPIKYGIGVTDSSADSNILTLNFIKNPLLITNNLNNSGLSQTYAVSIYTSSVSPDFGFDLGSGTVPKEVVSGTNISSGDFSTLQTLLPSTGSYIHCYMRGVATSSIPVGGFPVTPNVSESAVLVRLFRKGSSIYIQNYASKSEPFTVYGSLTPVRMYTFNAQGTITPFTGDFTHTKYEDQKKWNESAFVGTFESVAQLSGASVSQDFRLSPVAETGNTVFSLYTNQGGSQFDLTDYFAYNKEYISYPLTNEVDILCAYAMWESTSSTIQPVNTISVVNSLTWEEQ